ncbi:MAG: hypothetical protein K2G15_05450, partial [Muribaculaceae bacterium]|nr:hypothetical protein [Muribaculaceae bacterium]
PKICGNPTILPKKICGNPTILPKKICGNPTFFVTLRYNPANYKSLHHLNQNTPMERRIPIRRPVQGGGDKD